MRAAGQDVAATGSRSLCRRSTYYRVILRAFLFSSMQMLRSATSLSTACVGLPSSRASSARACATGPASRLWCMSTPAALTASSPCMVFRLRPPPAVLTPILTLQSFLCPSEWGLIVHGLALVSFGSVYLIDSCVHTSWLARFRPYLTSSLLICMQTSGRRVKGTSRHTGAQTASKMHFVDLAGSECVGMSGVTGQALAEVRACVRD